MATTTMCVSAAWQQHGSSMAAKAKILLEVAFMPCTLRQQA
jgi:hypothetical protein